MPKRKVWDIPVLKFGKNGDFFVNFSGRKVYLGRDEKEARKAYIEFLRKIAGDESGPAVAKDRKGEVEVQELILDALRKYAEHPKYQKMKRALQALRKAYGTTKAVDFGRVKFQAVRRGFVEEGLAGSYVNELMRFVIWCFELGVENEKIAEGIPAALRMVKPLKKGDAKVNPPRLDAKDEDILKVLPFLSQTIRDMVVIQRLSGMRPSELFQLKESEIQKKGDIWIYSPENSKSDRFGKKRVIGLGKVEQRILKRRSEFLRPGELFFQPKHAVLDRYGEGVADGRCVRQLKEMYSKDSYRRAVVRGIERARERGVHVQHWSPYQLRHSAATSLSAQFGREAAGVVLGHASVKVTAVYDHSDQVKVQKIISERDAGMAEEKINWMEVVGSFF